jgi:signal transduction histidine kinase
MIGSAERPIVLADLPFFEKVKEVFPKAMAVELLPPDCNQERLLFSVRSALNSAKLQHDLEALEGVAWKEGGSQSWDARTETLGAAVFDLASARDIKAIQEALRIACSAEAAVKDVRVIPAPDTAGSTVMNRYQLAVPVPFGDGIAAHIYLELSGSDNGAQIERLSELLLQLTPAVALAVERNRMLMAAEETKTVWEASFDAVADPVVILDEALIVSRANRSYASLSGQPVVRLIGTAPLLFGSELLAEWLHSDESRERTTTYQGRTYRVFLDRISLPLGEGRYVLRYHDVTNEHQLTEKILAKEQTAELGVLVSSVAHEVNNPIGGVLALSHILLQDLSEKNPAREDVENIRLSAERCKRILHTMLSLVRKADETMDQVDLRECLRSSLALLGSELSRWRIRLLDGTDKGGGAALVTGNKNRLTQTFLHILQQSIASLAERRNREDHFEAVLQVDLVPGFGHWELRLEDTGESAKHEIELQSSVAYTVTRMLLEDHGAEYQFLKQGGRNVQRIIFFVREGKSS